MTDYPVPPPGQGPPEQPFGAPPPAGEHVYGQPVPPPQQQHQQYGYGYGYGSGHAAVPAGFWARFAAALIDGLILAVPTFLLRVAVHGDISYMVSAGPLGTDYDPLVTFTSIVIGLLYFGLMEGGPTGQTIGKKALSIRVVDATTGQPGVGAARGIGRYFARWLSEMALLLGYLWMLWDPKKQTWHDKLTRVQVVKTG
jgi:uncharacterized RDD family membrane protein YckC